jgi:hypothetical protein
LLGDELEETLDHRGPAFFAQVGISDENGFVPLHDASFWMSSPEPIPEQGAGAAKEAAPGNFEKFFN